MDTFSFLQIIERIPELRFKYMGSYPSDTVPQLTKDSFAIINSAPSNDRGEHWIMIALLLCKFFGKKEINLPLFDEKVSTNGSSKATKD